VVLMGRKTWQSCEVGCKPFKDRYTVVISNTMKKENLDGLAPVSYIELMILLI